MNRGIAQALARVPMQLVLLFTCVACGDDPAATERDAAHLDVVSDGADLGLDATDLSLSDVETDPAEDPSLADASADAAGGGDAPDARDDVVAVDAPDTGDSSDSAPTWGSLGEVWAA
jgi:hypothetical protein